jgi:copper oxidase (laccase) domain-containing protein
MERQGARRRHIVAAVGPAINQDSYEVSPEFEADLIKVSPDDERFFSRARPDARPHFDLPGYVHNRLLAAGLGLIERHSPCTYANESLFYSYRRSQHLGAADYGRQISAIVVA